MTTSKKGAATAARKKPGPAARKKARAELARAGQLGAAIAAAANNNFGGAVSGRVKLSERERELAAAREELYEREHRARVEAMELENEHRRRQLGNLSGSADLTASEAEKVKNAERQRLVEAVAYLPNVGHTVPVGPAPALTQEQIEFVNCQSFTRELVENLAKRLQPLLRAAQLTGDEDRGPQPVRNRSALAEWLAFITGSQADTNRILLELHDRLDLE